MICYLVLFVSAYLISYSLETDKDYFCKIDNLLYEKITHPSPGEGGYLIDSLVVFNREFNQSIQVI
jgi:hypothetical protein